MAEAWGKVTCIIVTSPRMSKSNFGLEKLRAGVPELFETDGPVPAIKTYGVRKAKAPHYHEEKQFFSSLDIPLVENVGELPLAVAAEEAGRTVWEHDGQCQCGRRTFLFGQCLKCLRDELADKGEEIIEKADVPEEHDDEAEENVPIGTMRQLGDPLPELPVAKGNNTRSVLFITDKLLHTILKRESIHV